MGVDGPYKAAGHPKNTPRACLPVGASGSQSALYQHAAPCSNHSSWCSGNGLMLVSIRTQTMKLLGAVVALRKTISPSRSLHPTEPRSPLTHSLPSIPHSSLLILALLKQFSAVWHVPLRVCFVGFCLNKAVGLVCQMEEKIRTCSKQIFGPPRQRCMPQQRDLQGVIRDELLWTRTSIGWGSHG